MHLKKFVKLSLALKLLSELLKLQVPGLVFLKLSSLACNLIILKSSTAVTFKRL